MHSRLWDSLHSFVEYGACVLNVDLSRRRKCCQLMCPYLVYWIPLHLMLYTDTNESGAALNLNEQKKNIQIKINDQIFSLPYLL